jgi:apolipoprotein D and lipocalin family protein
MTSAKASWCLLAALVISTAALAFTGRAGAESKPAPQTVSFVDLDRYVGTWYEIASIPNRFQKHCRGNTMASYRAVEHARIEVINSCLDKNGTVDRAKGVARVVDSASNAKLEVSFVSLFGWQLFWGDYWILDLAPDYSYVVVGTPDYRYGWLLSRTPVMSAEIRDQVDDRIRAAGYDPEVFVNTPQGID